MRCVAYGSSSRYGGATQSMSTSGAPRAQPPSPAPTADHRCADEKAIRHVTGHAVPGLARRMANRLAFGSGSLAGETGQDIVDVDPFSQRFDGDEVGRAVGERAGLVDAQHVDAGETFESAELTDEHALATEADDPDRERGAQQQAPDLPEPC